MTHTLVASATREHIIGFDRPFTVIGERINPTGRKKLAAEMVAATKGLGYMVLSASQFLQTPVVILGIFVIAIIAFAFDLLMRFVERRLVPWKGRM